MRDLVRKRQQTRTVDNVRADDKEPFEAGAVARTSHGGIGHLDDLEIRMRIGSELVHEDSEDAADER